MKEKTRKILIMAVMAALIVSLMAASFAALTYGRYSGGRFDENSPYEDYIDFVGATAYEVSSPEELVNAINNGYSYIKIAADAEEPFVVNNDIADVEVNLVLDVNGHVVVRNSRNPLINVQKSVSVVLVYDSSTTADGGFYNPVGSALQTSGGSLTVGSGVYESGPSDAADATLPSSNAVSLVTRENRTSTSYNAAQSGVSLPILTKSGGDKTKSGDKYLPENWTDTVSGDQINPDTYLLYTEVQNAFVGSGQTADGAIPDASAPADPDNPVVFQSGQLYINCDSSTIENNGTTTTTYSADIFSPVSNVASCDFYYYYPIDNDAYSTTAGSPAAPKTYAVVYGYNDVKALASNKDQSAETLQKSGLVWPYAAIRSVEDEDTQEGGVTHARGGAFTTNFGTDNTYGILSVGGEMTVGTESATAPPTFTAVGEGTCIGMSAGENDTLTIASGNFSSQVGDTILMRGGEMTVTGGTFTKSGNKARPSSGTLEEIEASRTALVHMRGGDLTIDGTFTDKKYSVTMVAGSEQTPLTNVFGIYSAEDDTSGRATAGTVSVSGCSIAVHGTYSAGVLSSAGTVNLGGTAAGKAETNITVNNSISNNLLTSSAVSSEGGTIKLNNTVNITSDSLGITARGIINVGDETTQAAANVTVNTENATGVYVNNGTLNVNAGATLSVDSTISYASYSWVTPPESTGDAISQIYNGVFVHGGSLTSDGTLDVTFKGIATDARAQTTTGTATKSYAVFVEPSAAATQATVEIAGGTITGTNAGGIYVGDSDATSTQENISVTVGSASIKAQQTYAAGILTEKGTVELENTAISSSALGVAVIGGDVTVKGGSYDENGKIIGGNTITASRATGIYVRGGELKNEGVLTVNSTVGYPNNVNGNYTEYYENAGADISTVESNTNIYNGVYVNGGSLNSTGTLNVDFTGVQSDNVGSGDNRNLDRDTAYRNFQVKSYAVRVEASGTTSSTVTIRKGEITNSCGGGVLAANGTVTLGTSGNENKNLTVLATAGEGIMPGTDRVHYDNCTIDGNSTDNWEYGPPKWGGDAIKTDGGTLTVDGGSYTAYYGNGILVTNGSATVNGGEFSGRDSRRINGGLYTGAGGNYGLKVLGGYATVNGGTFIDWVLDDNGNRVSGGGGGVFIMGTPTEEGETPKVTTIEKAIIDVTGATGVALWEYANVVFGTEDSTNNSDLSVRAESTGMTVEYTRDDARQNITIYSGTFESYGTASNKNGIWYGEGGATLNIEGGVFKGSGSNGRGLLIANNPVDEIEISGGTFVGGTGGSAISAGVTLSTSNIIASGSYCYYNNVDTPLRTSRNNNAAQVGGSTQGSVYLGNTVYYQLNGNWYSSAFNDLGTIVVQSPPQTN